MQCLPDDRKVMQLQHNLSFAPSFINRFRGTLPRESADGVVPTAIESYMMILYGCCLVGAAFVR